MKKWMIFFVIVAALLVGANSYAPQLAEAGLCQALSATLNLHSDDVRVQASPGAKIFLGDIDAITVHATNFQAGDLTSPTSTAISTASTSSRSWPWPIRKYGSRGQRAGK